MKQHISFDLDLKRNPYPGTYIAIEGIDGSGKSTQVELVTNYFTNKGLDVVRTSEPNDSLLVGKLIREILFSKIKVPSKAYQSLYSADRVVNHETIVTPALKSGKMVLSHRSFWSVVPHGILDVGKEKFSHSDADPILVANGVLSHYYQFLAADLVFYLDVSVEAVMQRFSKAQKKTDLYEKHEKLATIRRGYQWEIENFPGEFTVINGEQDETAITQEIILKIEEYLKRRRNQLINK